MTTCIAHLLPNEQKAVQIVTSLGLQAAYKELDEIHNKADLRMKDLCGEELLEAPGGFTTLDYMSKEALNRRHTLNMGISLSQPSPAAIAKKKILARVAARKKNKIK